MSVYTSWRTICKVKAFFYCVNAPRGVGETHCKVGICTILSVYQTWKNPRTPYKFYYLSGKYYEISRSCLIL